MEKLKMTYGSIRHLLGYSSLIIWVILAGVGIYFDIGEWFADCGHGPAVTFGTFWGIYVFLHTPFDLIAGYVLPKRFGHVSHGFVYWLSKWSRGVLLHATMLWLSSLTIFWIAELWGPWAATVWVAIQMALLTRFQFILARLFSPMKIDKISKFSDSEGHLRDLRFFSVSSEDHAFTGGVVGSPGREAILLPFSWRDQISEDVYSILRARKVGAVMSGSRTRGLILAILWNVVWFAIAGLLSSAPLSTMAGVIETSLWFSLFCALGLLGFLPFWSRRGSVEIDHWTHSHGACEFKMQKAISFTNKMKGDDPCRPQWVENTVSSIPSVENRLRFLFMGQKQTGAWHAAQNMLFLSWAGMGLVSRCMPSNLGHPDLWVIFPCD